MADKFCSGIEEYCRRGRGGRGGEGEFWRGMLHYLNRGGFILWAPDSVPWLFSVYALHATLMHLTAGYSSMQLLNCDSHQAFKQWSRNSKTTQYPPTFQYKSHKGVPHDTFPTVDLVEYTSYITSLLQHRCLTSWGKLPQQKTCPLASALHTNPSLSLVLSIGLSHTNTHRQRSKPHLLRPPSPQLLPGDVLRSHGWTAYRAIHREHPCSTMWQPRGQRKNPTASHCNEHQPPSKLASPGRFYCLLWFTLSF